MEAVRLQTELKALETPAACRFCKTVVENDIVIGKDGASICYRCIYLANVVKKTFPQEAIYCFKCKSFRGKFRVVYGSNTNTPAAVITFSFLELDCRGKPVYGAVGASAAWHATKSTPIESTCCGCNNKLPLWMLIQNSYMRTYNHEPNEGQVK